ncbi:MAG TPA: GYF domain-containing protein [Polyangiaceae bacterium]
MKFLCDQCKAKYQISDDKVAGKTVRMKCRKCGHMIEVRAAVTETSVATGLPSEPPPAPGGSSANRAPAAPGRTSLATSLSQAKPAPPRPGGKPEGGLAGAFKTTVQAKEDEAALLELSSADEWYAAINGVPVGPIRIGELRRKAALGAVTEESLVWQEGMEEWRPIRTVPELATLVREAAVGRHSLTAPEMPPGRGSVIPPAPVQSNRPAPLRPAPPRPMEPPPRPAAPLAAARSNVVPITSRLAPYERAEELSPAPVPITPPPPAPTSERFSLAPDPFALPPTQVATAAPAPAAFLAAPVSVVAPAPAAPPRQPNYIAIGMIVGFAAFGITLGLVFRPQPQPAPPPQVIVQPMPMPATPTAPTAAPLDSNAAPADSAVAAGGKGGGQGKGGAAVASAKPAASASGLRNLLDGLGAGPAVGGPSGPAAQATSLTAGQIEPVVRSHSLGVRRTCWERGSSTVNSANETLSLTIGGDGRVQNATSNGNDPVTGTCLEKETRTWQFPPTGATSKVDIPFHFVRQ